MVHFTVVDSWSLLRGGRFAVVRLWSEIRVFGNLISGSCGRRFAVVNSQSDIHRRIIAVGDSRKAGPKPTTTYNARIF